MGKIVVENAPDELVKRLELAAESQRSSVADQVISRLDSSFGGTRVSERRTKNELLELARRIRGEGNGSWLTPEYIRMARETGRE